MEQRFPRSAAALKEIATILREDGEESDARDIERLSNYALAIDPEYQELFVSQITGNYVYWFGKEGAIGHNTPEERERRRQFLLAYYELALACEAEGCASIWSERAKEWCSIDLRRMEHSR